MRGHRRNFLLPCRCHFFRNESLQLLLVSPLSEGVVQGWLNMGKGTTFAVNIQTAEAFRDAPR